MNKFIVVGLIALFVGTIVWWVYMRPKPKPELYSEIMTYAVSDKNDKNKMYLEQIFGEKFPEKQEEMFPYIQRNYVKLYENGMDPKKIIPTKFLLDKIVYSNPESTQKSPVESQKVILDENGNVVSFVLTDSFKETMFDRSTREVSSEMGRIKNNEFRENMTPNIKEIYLQYYNDIVPKLTELGYTIQIYQDETGRFMVDVTPPQTLQNPVSVDTFNTIYMLV